MKKTFTLLLAAVCISLQAQELRSITEESFPEEKEFDGSWYTTWKDTLYCIGRSAETDLKTLHKFDGEVLVEADKQFNSVHSTNLVLGSDGLYFTGNVGVGQQLFKYDGETVTSLMEDTVFYLAWITSYNDQIYFNARSEKNGITNTWLYDGDTCKILNWEYEGKRLTSFLHPNIYYDKLFFRGATEDVAASLFAWDGNEMSVVSDTIFTEAYPINDDLIVTVSGDDIAFVALFDQNHYTILKETSTGDTLFEPYNFMSYSDKIYFTAKTERTGYELWSYDGENVVLVSDIFPGSQGSSPEELIELGEYLYFAAETLEYGYELMKYDGQTASIAADILPGVESSGLWGLTAYKNKLYFTASDTTDDLHSYEMMEYTPAVFSTSLSEIKEISIYPNPTSGMVYFGENASYQVASIEGVVVASGEGSSVDLSALQSGVYFLSLNGKSVQLIKE